MRQRSLFELLPRPGERPAQQRRPPEVFDLFCGAGGFSEGARQAGCPVAFACDSSADAVECFRANHPAADCRLLELPSDAIPLPTDGRPFHVHGSPPCTFFSSAYKLEERSTAQSERLVRWFLDLALGCGCTSWSFEEVSCPKLLRILQEYRRRHLGAFAYALVDFSLLGVPQNRRRLLAGPPALVAAVVRQQEAHKVRSVRDVLSPKGQRLANSCMWKYKVLRKNRRAGETKFVYLRTSGELRPGSVSVDKPSPTILTNNNTVWLLSQTAGSGERATRALTVAERAALQTFPEHYRWLPRSTRVSNALVGNAVPPLVALTVMLDAKMIS